MRSPEGKLSLYCKGADTIIYERLHESCTKLMDVTTEHLNVSDTEVIVIMRCLYFKLSSACVERMIYFVGLLNSFLLV